MRCRKILLVLIVGMFLVLSLGFALASIELGDKSHEIDSSYGGGEVLRGWVNFSLDNEPSDSMIRGFDSNMTLINFLNENKIGCYLSDDCSCFPFDCGSKYSVKGSEASSKVFSLNILETKIIGIKLTGNVSQITDFSFEVSTDDKKSCIIPLMIDVLDCDGIEWKVKEVSEETCQIEKPYGCYETEDSINSTMIGTSPLCEKIIIPAMKGYRLGAKVIGSGPAVFRMSLDVGGSGENCAKSINGSGEISCDISLNEDLDGETEVDVCILAEAGNASKYKINYEDNNVCGYVGQGPEGDNEHDFEIFIKPLKYNSIKKFKFDNQLIGEDISLIEDIGDYIDRRYNGECDPECIVPIRFYSGVIQDINIFNLNLGYDSGGLYKDPITNFYEVEESPALISSDFMELRLEKANILVPNDTGPEELILRIGDKEIKEDINIKSIPKIKSVSPSDPVYLVPTSFRIILESGYGNLTYKWDFGDGTPLLTSNENKIEHTYTQMGDFELVVNVSNNLGSSGRIVNINVDHPYDAINKTIKKYKTNLDNVKNQIRVLPSWVKERIDKIEDVDSLQSAVNKLEDKYKQLFETDEEELVKIMADLIKLKVPYKFDSGIVIKPGSFVLGEKRLDTSVLDKFDVGNVEEGRSNSEYASSINQWLNENLDISFESKTYLFYYEDESEKVLLSEIKLVLNPKDDIDEFFIVIEGNINNIKFKKGEDYGERDIDENNFGIRFSELTSGEQKTIEFLHPEKVEFLNPPFYVSPEFRRLEFGVNVGPCNNNGVCDSGETYKNCRVDCKPWKLTIIFLGILLFVGFAVYIILQEWYKRYYESYLFKDKNHFFNLITFMNNCKNQRMGKEEIFNKLKPIGWNNEQLIYAWNKVNGKRTGMWEVPIFKLIEIKKIKQEIAKRRSKFGVGQAPSGVGQTPAVSRNSMGAQQKGFFKK